MRWPIRCWKLRFDVSLPTTPQPGAPSYPGSSMPTSPSPAPPLVCPPLSVLWVISLLCSPSRRMITQFTLCKPTSVDAARYGERPVPPCSTWLFQIQFNKWGSLLGKYICLIVFLHLTLNHRLMTVIKSKEFLIISISIKCIHRFVCWDILLGFDLIHHTWKMLPATRSSIHLNVKHLSKLI